MSLIGFLPLLLGCGSLGLRPKPQPLDPLLVPGSARGHCANPTAYTIGVPDVLEVRFAAQPQWDCLAAVDLDGCVDLGERGRVRVEGGTLDDAALNIAQATAQPLGQVLVRLVDGRSQYVYLSGPDRNRLRTVAYTGPEPVLAFLNRTAGVPLDRPELREVCVVRANVARGHRPEVFRVDLRGKPSAGTPPGEVLIQPGDQVYIQESSRSWWRRHKPNWLAAIVQWWSRPAASH